MTKMLHKKMRKAVQKEGLEAISFFSKSLTDSGLPCSPFFGTLLGLVRDGKLIEFDDDIDLAVLINNKDDWSIITSLFEKKGFSLTYCYLLNDEITEMSFFRRHLRIDVFGCKKNTNEIVLYSYYSKNGYSYPKKNYKHCMEHRYLFSWELTEKTYVGYCVSTLCQKESEILLEQMYGNDWRVPNPNWTEKETEYEKEKKGCFGVFIDYSKKKS